MLNPAYYVKRVEMVFRACFPIKIVLFKTTYWAGCYWAVLVVQCGEFFTLLIYKLPRFWWWSLRGDLDNFLITNVPQTFAINSDRIPNVPVNNGLDLSTVLTGDRLFYG